MDATFHVGLHKTGTTFLQREVFPRLPGVLLAGQHDPLRRLLDENAPRVLVSDEGLAGMPLEGGWLAGFRPRMERLEALFPGSRVVIGIRRHRAMLLSLYKQYLHGGGVEPFERWNALAPEDLLFTPRLETLAELFDGRVFVYLQEELEEDLEGFLRDLGDFLGVRAPHDVPRVRWNEGVRARQAALLRALNRFDARLRRLPGKPTLYNPVFRRLHLTPRGLCQVLLRCAGGPPLALPPERAREIDERYAADWEAALSFSGIARPAPYTRAR